MTTITNTIETIFRQKQLSKEENKNSIPHYSLNLMPMNELSQNTFFHQLIVDVKNLMLVQY
jgi:hypothetical protein